MLAPQAVLPLRYRIYCTRVRDAGPENMAHPPRDWDTIDQAIDESFPAGDSSTSSRFI